MAGMIAKVLRVGVAGVAALALVPSMSSVAQAGAPSSKAALREAVTDYSRAYLNGNGTKAYRMLTPRCRAVIPRGPFNDSSDLAAIIYGNLHIETYRAKVRGTRARVTYTFSDPDLNQRREPWVKVSGRWKNNDC
ncbi:hypothetical protein [Nocardioides sp. L-11A]|uniref:hypothetical protein n=1 Tax=Nocardioides sp. L-11A TaxID=3043848 RepID=UPI00249C0AD6|nr:hypothetical protein QJ852_15335 [Nocardioides sp. L-11A]